MRNIRELVSSEEKVWIYFRTEEICKKFFVRAKEKGFNFGHIPYEKWVPGTVIAVHSDGRMGHLPLFIWTMSYRANVQGTPKRIDYERYANGGEDYLCREDHINGSIIIHGR
ncbi:MAG: hypothetical protein E7456_05360 [Ruminococcaceae bacterium]|nr:hypothetical protein [Oscillospiraceae bacterium]